MIRLIVQAPNGEDKAHLKDRDLLDTSFRVFEVENPEFEELIRAGGSLKLIGLEVTEACLAATPPAPATSTLPLAPVNAPTPALPALAGNYGAPASGPPSTAATRAVPKEGAAMRARYGRLQWRKWCGLAPYPNPVTASLPAVIKLPG
jgi:hypothetical protein